VSNLYRLTFGFPNWNTTQVFDVDTAEMGRFGEDAEEVASVVQEGYSRCDYRRNGQPVQPVLLQVERRSIIEWELLTNAFRLAKGDQVFLQGEWATFDHWVGRGNGLAFFVDPKGRVQGAFEKGDVFVQRSWEDILGEREARDEYDAETAYERHLENAGYNEARLQEDMERAQGIEEWPNH
jgi:hypothetical protein